MSAIPISTRPMTYEEYLAEGETPWRYDIIDGVRRDMASPSWHHQQILKKLFRVFDRFEAVSGEGQTVVAPMDVLIRRSPLRVRQLDILFISNRRLAALAAPPTVPLTVAPELVVEILSDSDRIGVLSGKIADYVAIGVEEIWLVTPDPQTIEVRPLSPAGEGVGTVYGAGQTAQSRVFSGLAISVDAVFAV